MTSKGQTTIPAEIRERLGLKPGDRLDYVIDEDGKVVLEPATRDITELRGALKRPGQKRRSVAQMNAAVRERFEK